MSFDHTVRLHDPEYRGFASDNYAGIHPEVLTAIAAANKGHQIAYGEDLYTARLKEVMAEHFGEGVEAFPVFNGTGANVVGLQSTLPRWGAVICTQTAIHTDERRPRARCGAKAAYGSDARRQTHPRAHHPRGMGLGRRAPGSAARGIDFADHRTRHRVYRRRGAGDR